MASPSLHTRAVTTAHHNPALPTRPSPRQLAISPKWRVVPSRHHNFYPSGTTTLRVQCNSNNEDDTRRVEKAGAGKSWVSPDWLTSIVRLGKGPDTSGIPVADAKLEDVKDLLGGALFLPLFKWMTESGPVYRLAAGPRNFVIVGDPAVAKHVLRGYGAKYSKGLVAEVAEFLFGSGFAIAENELWTVCNSFSWFPSLHCTVLFRA